MRTAFQSCPERLAYAKCTTKLIFQSNRRLLPFILAILLIPHAVFADTIIFKSGATKECIIEEETSTEVKFRIGKAVVTISYDKIESVHYASPKQNRELESRWGVSTDLGQAGEDLFALGNESVRMLFDTGNGGLFSVLDKKTGMELLSYKALAGKSLFELRLISTNGTSLRIDNVNAREFSGEVHSKEGSSEFAGAWKYDWGTVSATVTLTVNLPGDSPFSTWGFEVDVTGEALLDSVIVPVLAGIGKLGESASDDRLLVPEHSGRLYVNPSEKLARWEQVYPSGFASMQFMAYYDSMAGFYLSSLDERGLSKILSWKSKDGKWAIMQLVFQGLAGTGDGKSFKTDVTLGVFHGGWALAASRYRDWAEKQSWSEWTINKKKTPAWLTQAAIGKDFYAYTMVGVEKERTYKDWVQKIEEHREFFSLPTLAMLWGWEHGGQWVSGDYFPPQEGWDAFDEAVRGLRHSNAWPYLFINGEAIRKDTPAWRSKWGPGAAIQQSNGEPFVRSAGVQMCLESEDWLSYLSRITVTLADHDVGLIQWDGFPLCPLIRRCYSSTHRHGPVPGGAIRPYEVLRNLQVIRSDLRASHPSVALSGEEGAELYLPVLDVLHSRDCWAEIGDPNVGGKRAQVVPLFHFVYHPNVIFLGEYHLGPWPNWGEKDYHKLAIGRCFIWGEICSYSMQDWIRECASMPSFSLLKRCAQARAGFLRDFLVFGRMLPPPELDVQSIEINVDDKGWLSAYASTFKGFRGEFPSVLASAWHSERGDVAIILLSIAERALTTSVPLSQYQPYFAQDSKVRKYLNNKLESEREFDPNQPELMIRLEPLQFAAFVFRNQ